jgi:ferric-dicitrate binding protein FerR (iron transport regulator)
LSLPFPTSINVKHQKRDALFASPRQQSEIIDESESLDWLQKRLGLHDGHSIALAKRFPEAHALSVEEQLASALDWLQQRIGLSNKELGELVRRRPTILNASGKLKLDDAGLRKLVEKHPSLLD